MCTTRSSNAEHKVTVPLTHASKYNKGFHAWYTCFCYVPCGVPFKVCSIHLSARAIYCNFYGQSCTKLKIKCFLLVAKLNFQISLMIQNLWLPFYRYSCVCLRARLWCLLSLSFPCGWYRGLVAGRLLKNTFRRDYVENATFKCLFSGTKQPNYRLFYENFPNIFRCTELSTMLWLGKLRCSWDIV